MPVKKDSKWHKMVVVLFLFKPTKKKVPSTKKKHTHTHGQQKPTLRSKKHTKLPEAPLPAGPRAGMHCDPGQQVWRSTSETPRGRARENPFLGRGGAPTTLQKRLEKPKAMSIFGLLCRDKSPYWPQKAHLEWDKKVIPCLAFREVAGTPDSHRLGPVKLCDCWGACPFWSDPPGFQP